MLTRLRAWIGAGVSNLEWVWRDPLRVIESEVKAPWLRSACEGLLVLRLAAGDLFGVPAWIDVTRWRLQGARLRQDAGSLSTGLWRPVTRSGSAFGAMPRRFVVSAGADAVVSAFSAEGRFLGGGVATFQRPVFLRSPQPVHALAAYPLNDSEATLLARPLLGLGVLAAERRTGSSLREALQTALPPRARTVVGMQGRAYGKWLERRPNAPTPATGMERLVSVLTPVHDPEPAHLRAAIASVLAQTHPHVQLCLVDDGSQNLTVRAILSEAAKDSCVTLRTLAAPGGVSRATNAALEMATGELVAFFDHDDLLVPTALATAAAAFDDERIVAIYSDEDTIDVDGRPRSPTFKTRFDAERLLSQNFANHLFCARTEAVRALGGLDPELDGAQDHDLVLRLSEAAADAVRHLPGLLYRWRRFPGGRSFSQREPQKAASARRRAVEAQLARTGRQAQVTAGEGGFNRIVWPLPSPPPLVRVIIPTRNGGPLLTGCVASLRAVTDYPALEVVVVDNGSTDADTLQRLEMLAAAPMTRVIRDDGPFNHSRLNNLAASDPGAELLCLLNDDILIVEPGWLREMASLAVRPDVGAVGAKLLYPDGRLQHGGVVLGLGGLGVAGHELRGAPGDAPGLQHRLLVTREVEAVTAACLVIGREKYLSVGGLDAETFPVAYNDVDLCLRLSADGFRTLWTPHARLLHVESASRGRGGAGGREEALQEAADNLHARWGRRLGSGADYPAALSRRDETFSLA